MVKVADEIITKAQQGDLRAFEEIYKTFFGYVSNVAFRIVGGTEDAEEITQDVFMKIYHHLKDFKFQSSLSTWVYRIMVNSALNYVKKEAQKKRNVPYIDELSSQPQEPSLANREYQEKLVNELLGALNPDQRAVIVLRSIEGLSYEEIAQSLQIPLNTVRSRIKRARETMLALKKEVIQSELQ